MRIVAKILVGKKFTHFIAVVLLLLLCHTGIYAQQPPPKPISVSFNPSQGLRFGAFFVGSTGGTVTILPDGSRSSTGGVVLASLGFVYGAANFELVANPGTLVSIMNGPDATLTGSGGGSMTMHIGTSSPVVPFITSATPPAYTSINIGGTLTVGTGSSNPAGSYSGSFLVTFIQE